MSFSWEAEMDFWSAHPGLGGVFFLFACAFFPRLTLAWLSLISGVIGVTFWGVVGWIFMPRLVVAILATTIYWNTNPVLCVFSWLCMFSFEYGEKRTIASRQQRHEPAAFH